MAMKYFQLTPGKKYTIAASLQLMPVHRDELFCGLKQDQSIENVKDPKFEILEIRRTNNAARTIWYKVRLNDGRVGWFNSIGMVNKHIKIM
ncbi:MAG: hypothetical protein DRQ46_00225 [Gammaproteobacteria bacterium]|nr:MAG: hypothetical protein DRQ46_00225 [Gammaproteobacteria bacterium]